MNIVRGYSRFCRKFSLIILLVIFIPAQAYENSQLQWAPGTSSKLQRGEVLTYNDYTIEADQFPSPVESDRYNEAPAEPVEGFVGVNISKNGIFISRAILMPGDSYILPDGELSVTANTLPSKNGKEWLYESYNPWAVIEVNPRGKPDLQIQIDTDEEKYISGSSKEIVATLQIENSGQADATNVDVSLETQLPLKRGELKYHYDTVKKGEVITETIAFDIPDIKEQKMYGIMANVTGFDVKNIFYGTKSQKDIMITTEPERGLSLRKTTFDKLYLKDTAMITLSLKNNGKLTVTNITIQDSLPREFKLVGNKTLNWIIDLPAGGEWTYRYLVKPIEANKDGIVFPSATAEYMIKQETYDIRSNQPKVRVNGPGIVLTKNSDISEIDMNETVNILKIMLTVENIGNTPTKVIINDTIPENGIIIDGNKTFEAFLEAGKKVSYNYSIRVDSPPPIKIPAAIANYFELGTTGIKISTSSQEFEIKAKVPELVTGSGINESFDKTNSEEAIKLQELSKKLDNVLSSLFGCNSNGQNIFLACNFSTQKKSVTFPPISTHLVSYWSFDEGAGTVASDSAGNGNNGNLINGPVWVDGKIGKALEFDGIDDYVIINSATGIPAAPPFTIELWVNEKTFSNSKWKDFFRKEGSWALMVDRNGNLDMEITFIQDTISNVTIPINVWTHLAVTFEDTSVKFYKDGVLADEKIQANIPNPGFNSIYIGGNSWNTYIDATLDEIKVYDRALTAQEIKAEFLKLTPAPITTPSPAITPTSTTTPALTPTLSKSSPGYIQIFDSKFNPAELKVVKGTTVFWTNKESAFHILNLSINGEYFSSPELYKSQNWSFTFNGTGTFEYSCSKYPWMTRGRIIVE